MSNYTLIYIRDCGGVVDLLMWRQSVALPLKSVADWMC